MVSLYLIVTGDAFAFSFIFACLKVVFKFEFKKYVLKDKSKIKFVWKKIMYKIVLKMKKKVVFKVKKGNGKVLFWSF